jgi:hypothetical protein
VDEQIAIRLRRRERPEDEAIKVRAADVRPHRRQVRRFVSRYRGHQSFEDERHRGQRTEDRGQKINKELS